MNKELLNKLKYALIGALTVAVGAFFEELSTAIKAILS